MNSGPVPPPKPLVRHAVPIYFGFVFLISWGGGFLILGPDGYPPSASEFEHLGALLYVPMMAGPCVAGVLMTGLVAGRPGLYELFARLTRWRVGARWYAVALLPALAMVSAALLLSLVSPVFRPAFLDAGDQAARLLAALGPALLVGVFEEIGWTGFAVPRLRVRRSIFVTGLLVGFMWGAWHLPLFQEADSFSGALPLTVLLARLFSWLPAFRILLVWAHHRTQSLPVVMLMHASVSFVAITLAPEGLTGGPLLVSLLALATVMWLAAVLVGAEDRVRSANGRMPTA